MTDFASAAMVRVLVRGMEMLGMKKPVVLEFRNQATVPLDLKRAVVTAAVEQGGLACLPLLGRGVHDFSMEPTHLALTTGRSASALFMRWQRLERYIHSRHIIRIDEITDHSARIAHIHRDEGLAPLPIEDLVVCGVLCALLEANGLEDVTAQVGEIEVYPNLQQVTHLLGEGQTSAWCFKWRSPRANKPLIEPSNSWDQIAPQLWSGLARAAGGLVARNFPEPLPITEASKALGLSSRSFQRGLASEKLTYTELVSEVRFRMAGWYLIKTKMPIAEVGFVSGYSDQAHLTRDLNRRMGLTPGKYRAHFASC